MSGTDLSFLIRSTNLKDSEKTKKILCEKYGAVQVISRGKIYTATDYPGFVAEIENEIAGLLIYRIEKDEMEILTLNSLRENLGIGSALIERAKQEAIKNNCKRLWLITTNDNTQALKFYQKRGFTIVAVYPNAMEQSRKLKPQIPLYGYESIPIRDEIELEIIL